MSLRVLLAAAILMSASAANATCFGTGSFKTCTDQSGNTYTVSQFGNTTNVNGYNPRTGSSWNQNSYTFGNTTQTYGRDKDGRSWNQTATPYSIYGTDSDGNSYYVPQWPKKY